MNSGGWCFLGSGDILALVVLLGEMWSRAKVATCTVSRLGGWVGCGEL